MNNTPDNKLNNLAFWFFIVLIFLSIVFSQLHCGKDSQVTLGKDTIINDVPCRGGLGVFFDDGYVNRLQMCTISQNNLLKKSGMEIPVNTGDVFWGEYKLVTPITTVDLKTPAIIHAIPCRGMTEFQDKRVKSTVLSTDWPHLRQKLVFNEGSRILEFHKGSYSVKKIIVRKPLTVGTNLIQENWIVELSENGEYIGYKELPNAK